MDTTNTPAGAATVDERPIVWLAYVKKNQIGQGWTKYPEVPYFTDEAEAHAWCEKAVAEELDVHGERVLRWRLQGHVEAGYPTTGPLGRDAFEPLPDGFFQYYALIGEIWAWTSLGFRPE